MSQYKQVRIQKQVSVERVVAYLSQLVKGGGRVCRLQDRGDGKREMCRINRVSKSLEKMKLGVG